MKAPICLNTHSYLPPLFTLIAICLLGFTACSSVDPPAGRGFHAAIIGKLDSRPNDYEDVVAANRDWYQLIH
jgi:hypothetical protein